MLFAVKKAPEQVLGPKAAPVFSLQMPWPYDNRSNHRLSYFCARYPQAADWLRIAPILQVIITTQQVPGYPMADMLKVLNRCAAENVGLKKTFKALGLPWQLRHYQDLELHHKRGGPKPLRLYSFIEASHPFSQMTDLGLTKGMTILSFPPWQRAFTLLCRDGDHLSVDFSRWLLKVGIYSNQMGALPSLGDFDGGLHQEGRQWTMSWTFDQAVVASERWHEVTAAREAAQSTAHYDDKTEYIPAGWRRRFLYQQDDDLVEACLITTRRGLAIESHMMRHCVGWDSQNYWKQQKTGSIAIVHLKLWDIAEGQDPVAAMTAKPREYTAEYKAGTLSLRQVQGKKGTPVPNYFRYMLQSLAFTHILEGAKPPDPKLNPDLKEEMPDARDAKTVDRI